MDPNEARRAIVCERLRAMPGVRLNVPDGAFYAFFDVSGTFGRTPGGKAIKDSVSFCQAALEVAHVNFVPGAAFGCEGFVRMSYAASREQINGGLPDRLQGEFNRLIEKRRAGTITEAQARQLHRLTDKAELFDARRLRCLVELAGLRKTTLDKLMRSLGLKTPAYA